MCEAVTTFLVGTAATEGAAATSGIIGTAGVLSPAVSIGASAAGLGLSAIGAYQQSAQANAQAKYQSEVMKQNQDMAEQAAQQDRYQGYLNSEAQKRKATQVIGAQRAQEGASGAVVDNGSYMDLTLDTAERGTLDALALQHQGDVQAWKDEVQATNYGDQATLYNAASKRDPFAAIGGSLLEGAGQIGSNWYKMTNGKAA